MSCGLYSGSFWIEAMKAWLALFLRQVRTIHQPQLWNSSLVKRNVKKYLSPLAQRVEAHVAAHDLALQLVGRHVAWAVNTTCWAS